MGTQYVWIDAFALEQELALKRECTCPNCKVVWQHYDSKVWIKEHFGYAVGPVTCPECGTQSVAGSAKRYKPRKRYVEPEPEPEPVLTRTERQRKLGWFRRPLEPATPPKPKQKGAKATKDHQR